VNNQADTQWVDLLHVAKEIRRSVQPVRPSAGFQSHLRSDLATALGAERRDLPLKVYAQRQVTPAVVLAGCLGLAAVSVALILLRGHSARQ